MDSPCQAPQINVAGNRTIRSSLKLKSEVEIFEARSWQKKSDAFRSLVSLVQDLEARAKAAGEREVQS